LGRRDRGSTIHSCRLHVTPADLPNSANAIAESTAVSLTIAGQRGFADSLTVALTHTRSDANCEANPDAHADADATRQP
jgi:hypothetical protein